MAKFFTSPNNLLNWVKTQNHTAVEAADKLFEVIGSKNHEQDIAESTRRIFANQHADHAAEVIFSILSRYDITEAQVKQASQKIGEIYAANELLKNKMITAEQHAGLVKQAQIMRQPGQYNMELRVCPKLPASIGNRRISTYNCLHYCLDSMVLDDEPNRVYCMEALWRKHVMDKFSRDCKDPKTGQLVGGYIANRFYSFPQWGTPANPDVPRDGGNPLELIPGQRTRQPRPHEYSVERRLQEQRNPGSTKSLMVGASANEGLTKEAGFHAALITQANAVGFTKISSADAQIQSDIYPVFSMAIDLHNEGLSREDAAVKLAKTFKMPVESVVKIQEVAIRKMATHTSDVYLVKMAQPVMPASPAALEQAQQAQGFKTEGMLLTKDNTSIPDGQTLIPLGTEPNTTKFMWQEKNQQVELTPQDAQDLFSMAQDASMLMEGKMPQAQQPASNNSKSVTAPKNAAPASTPSPAAKTEPQETPVY